MLDNMQENACSSLDTYRGYAVGWYVFNNYPHASYNVPNHFVMSYCHIIMKYLFDSVNMEVKMEISFQTFSFPRLKSLNLQINIWLFTY